MNDDTEAWALADTEECRCDINTGYQGKRTRLSCLDNGIESPKKRNEKSKVGSYCRCPMCGKKFIKKVYQQKFCCIKCKNNYHNKRQIYY